MKCPHKNSCRAIAGFVSWWRMSQQCSRAERSRRGTVPRTQRHAFRKTRRYRTSLARRKDSLVQAAMAPNLGSSTISSMTQGERVSREPCYPADDGDRTATKCRNTPKTALERHQETTRERRFGLQLIRSADAPAPATSSRKPRQASTFLT